MIQQHWVNPICARLGSRQGQWFLILHSIMLLLNTHSLNCMCITQTWVNQAAFVPGFWFSICLLSAAAAAACGAGTVTVGVGAPCFTVFVASIVLSAPGGMILVEDMGTKKKTKQKKVRSSPKSSCCSTNAYNLR